jgi:hypothetical protein
MANLKNPANIYFFLPEASKKNSGLRSWLCFGRKHAQTMDSKHKRWSLLNLLEIGHLDTQKCRRFDFPDFREYATKRWNRWISWRTQFTENSEDLEGAGIYT